MFMPALRLVCGCFVAGFVSVLCWWAQAPLQNNGGPEGTASARGAAGGSAAGDCVSQPQCRPLLEGHEHCDEDEKSRYILALLSTGRLVNRRWRVQGS